MHSCDAPASHPTRAICGRPLTIALVGNPNTGKTTLFNALTGYRRHVANYPGVTVEAARGAIRGAPRPMELLDLPGAYSLAAASPDEWIVTQVASGHVAGQSRPDVLLAIVDASNLSRNLYLVSQLMELELPLVVAINMMDVARARGLEIDCARLAERLGAEVVPIVATRRRTLGPLIAALERAAGAAPPVTRADLAPELVEESRRLSPRWRFAEALRILQDHGGYAERLFLESGGSRESLDAARARIRRARPDSAKDEVKARYAWVGRVTASVVRRPETPVVTWSDRLDHVFTHRIFGTLILAAVLFVVFQALFAWTAPLMEVIDAAFAALSGWLGPHLPAGVVRSLVTDGLIGGVGAVVIFLPQIMALFGLIAVLEDCGYMARAAFMMDRVMRGLGLTGRAFIPLLSSFACAVPAIMGTRAIVDRRERFVTILLAPFMSCSARLPVYALLIAAFIPPLRWWNGWIGLQGLTLMAMYLVGVAVAIPIAWALHRTAFPGGGLSFMLELPGYKLPRPMAVLHRMLSAGRGFLARAGTVILAVNLVVWALGYFPRDPGVQARVEAQAVERGWDAEQTEQELAGARLRASYLGRMGRAIEPLVRPLGWDWRIGMAVIASFPAREVVIGTLGTIYNLGAEQDETSDSLLGALREARWADSGDPVFTVPVALSIMVFFALCAQCSSTLAVIGRETRSWRWPVASFVSMTVIAYAAAWAVAAVARWTG